MSKSIKDPKCEQRKEMCKSYSDGFCTILTDTDFGERQCPFFRDKLETLIKK